MTDKYQPLFPLDSFKLNDGTYISSPGITLRDWFAGMAIMGYCGTRKLIDTTPEEAYTLADAMLKERDK